VTPLRARLGTVPPLDGWPAGLRAPIQWFDSEAGLRRLRWMIAGLLVCAVAIFIGRGGARPADPTLVDGPVAASQRIPGFGEAGATLRTARGDHRLCVAVATSEPQRERGLMDRTDLAGYDGMAFRFPAPSSVTFYMRSTPMPLGIAWFDPHGRFVSSTEMVPCPDQPGCPTYGAAAPYTVALEVPAGGLQRLGIGPGSTLTVGGACA
jgi:uncharacterized membrane protein (UPF0127 family)